MASTTPTTIPPDVVTATSTPLQLSNITVDYDAIQSAFNADLQQQGSWSSLLPSGTGQALVRWLASATAFLSGGLARALQENYPDTARTPGGVLRAQRLFLGSRIIRARAGSLQMTLVRTDNLTTTIVVPPYQTWQVGGYAFFNRTQVVISAAGTPVTVTLYQGTLVTQTEQSDGTTFQRFVVGTPNQWDASDDDLFMVDSTGATWNTTTTGLWLLDGTTNTFRQSTLPDGTIECRFGDGTYGPIPPVGALTFTYASLQTAAETMTGPPPGTTVSLTGYAVSGTTTTAASDNQDPPTPEFYKAMGTGQPSNNGRAVSRPDYRAMALQYPGVIDAVFRGQAELNPGDYRYMNVVAATLLTTSVWTTQQWLAFKQWMETEVAISNVFLIRQDPTAVPVPTNVTIGAFPMADITALTTLATNVITDFYAPKTGSLGATLYPSDIVTAIAENATYQQAPNESGSLVDYVNVVLPNQPVVLPSTSYPVITPSVLQVNVVPTTRGVNGASIGAVIGL